MNEEEQVLKFIDPDNIVVTLKTTNNFETAELTDQRGIVYYLKRVKTKMVYDWKMETHRFILTVAVES